MTKKINTSQSWTGQDFTSFAVALLGTAYGWQSAIARQLNVDSRTVRRWVKYGPPDKIRDELLKMAGVEDDSGLAFPRDEWVLGDGIETQSNTRREYITHTRTPRFIARIVDIDELTNLPQPDEDPVDTTTGIVYRIRPSQIMCEFLWIDRPPISVELTNILEAAADAVGDY